MHALFSHCDVTKIITKYLSHHFLTIRFHEKGQNLYRINPHDTVRKKCILYVISEEMYQLLLEDGKKMGQYNPNVSPAQTAKKIAKVLYESEQMRGKRTFSFKFVKNRTKAEGGDKEYEFEAEVIPLSKSDKNLMTINGKTFLKKYDINVVNLLRA